MCDYTLGRADVPRAFFVEGEEKVTSAGVGTHPTIPTQAYREENLIFP
jgi:hypothetical protein